MCAKYAWCLRKETLGRKANDISSGKDAHERARARAGVLAVQLIPEEEGTEQVQDCTMARGRRYRVRR